MPRRSPGALRADPAHSTADRLSSLRIIVCPGPPSYDGRHTQLHIDGTELIAATNPELRGLDPDRVLRPGGPCTRPTIHTMPGSPTCPTVAACRNATA